MKLSDYYKEMRNKYGFDEGETPEGIEKIRKLIVKKVNIELRKSKNFKNLHLAAFDRSGLHNWCLIEFWDGNDRLNEPTPDMKSTVLQILLDLDQEYQIVEKVVARPIRIQYEDRELI